MSSKKLEKQVHFTAEGGYSVGCYDSKGSPVEYILIEGEPYISLDNSVDRFFSIAIANAKTHNTEVLAYKNYSKGVFACANLVGVVNNTFVSTKNSLWRYAERPCTSRELASFHLAMYKAHKNAAKSEVKDVK